MRQGALKHQGDGSLRMASGKTGRRRSAPRRADHDNPLDAELIQKLGRQIGAVIGRSAALKRCAVISGPIGNDEPKAVVNQRFLQHHHGIVPDAVAMKVENGDALPNVGVFDGTFRGLHLALLDLVSEPEVVGCSHESGKR